jgi:hypothetical protein
MPASELPKPLELDRLLEILDRHGVDFVIVGGIAGNAHGSALATFDLDIAYARDEANLRRVAAALREVQVTLRGAPADLSFQLDEQTLFNGANFTFDSELGSFDILGAIEGIRDYESLRADAVLVTIGGVVVRIASIDHLISMKRKANRPKDRVAVEEYIVLAGEQKKLAREEKEKKGKG